MGVPDTAGIDVVAGCADGSEVPGAQSYHVGTPRTHRQR